MPSQFYREIFHTINTEIRKRGRLGETIESREHERVATGLVKRNLLFSQVSRVVLARRRVCLHGLLDQKSPRR